MYQIIFALWFSTKAPQRATVTDVCLGVLLQKTLKIVMNHQPAKGLTDRHTNIGRSSYLLTTKKEKKLF